MLSHHANGSSVYMPTLWNKDEPVGHMLQTSAADCYDEITDIEERNFQKEVH
jgi:hypothetical protein